MENQRRLFWTGELSFAVTSLKEVTDLPWHIPEGRALQWVGPATMKAVIHGATTLKTLMMLFGSINKVVHCGFQIGLWTKLLRIPQSTRLGAKTAIRPNFELLLVRVTDPHWPDSKNSSLLCSLLFFLFPHGLPALVALQSSFSWKVLGSTAA